MPASERRVRRNPLKKVVYDASFQAQMLKAQNEENYSSASRPQKVMRISYGFQDIFQRKTFQKFKEAASANKWAWAQEDVAEDDDQVPTKVKYGKVSGLIQPVFDDILESFRIQRV